jgi:hypothetical protein
VLEVAVLELKRFVQGGLMSQATANVCVVILGVLLLIGLLMGIAGGTLPPPPEWLLGWTSWLTSALTIVLAPIAVVAAAQALHKYAVKG